MSYVLYLISYIIVYIVCRWFDQWKERNQIHFSFGEWSYVPQAIKSNFTDELNVPDTSSSCLDNKEILSACNIQSQQHTSSRWRLPVLSVPSPYSYRVQCIRKQSLSAIDTQNATSVYGFYFPPDVTNSELPDAQLWLCVYAK